MRRIGIAIGITTVASLAWVASAAPPRPGLDELPLADVLEVIVLEHEIIAIDARGGGQISERLRLEESVLWTGTRGAVGAALTDERILAVAASSGAWQTTRYFRTEERPEAVKLGDRVALVVTDRRAIGFDGGSGNLVESPLGPRERLVAGEVSENVAVVVTDRRALGLSPLVGGFFETKLHLHERVASVRASANLATVTTDRRILIFRTATGSWEERRLDLQ